MFPLIFAYPDDLPGHDLDQIFLRTHISDLDSVNQQAVIVNKPAQMSGNNVTCHVRSLE